MAEKSAIILFAQAPLPEQAGTELISFFSAKKCLELYSTYVEESAQFFQHHHFDFWLTCEESYQETLLLHNFPTVQGCKVAQGNMNERLFILTNHFLNYEEYKNIIFLFHSFTFLNQEVLESVVQAFRRTSRSVVPLTENGKKLNALAVGFPFSHLYEDMVWEKDEQIKLFKKNCKDAEIPCRLLETNQLVISNPHNVSENLQNFLQQQFLRFYQKLGI